MNPVGAAGKALVWSSETISISVVSFSQPCVLHGWRYVLPWRFWSHHPVIVGSRDVVVHIDHWTCNVYFETNLLSRGIA